MHWDNDMMHREIGDKLGVPRPTITRWFKLFGVSTQTHHRFTDKNLASWLYKTGKLKRKIRVKGPDRRIQGTKQNVNVDFFKRWSPEMAYVLGFFSADGGMFINSGGSKYLQFTSPDYEILLKIKRSLGAKQRISLKRKYQNCRKDCYLLQVGSKEMFADLRKLGFTPNKESTLIFPNVPDRYLCHFVRGNFDGDGCVTYGYYNRKDRPNKKYFYFQSKFACGSREFLEVLSSRLSARTNIGSGSICSKGKAWELLYSKKDTIELFNYMYDGTTSAKYLERKYNKFQKAFKILGDVV